MVSIFFLASHGTYPNVLAHANGQDDADLVEAIGDIVDGFVKKTPKCGNQDFVAFFNEAVAMINALQTNDSCEIGRCFKACDALWKDGLNSDTWIYDAVPSGVLLMKGLLIEMVQLDELGRFWYDGDEDAGYNGTDWEYFGWVKKRVAQKRKRSEDD